MEEEGDTMKKRIIAIQLLIMMLLVSYPAQIFAAGETTTVPANVTGFKSVSSYDSIVLKWKKVTGANGYHVKWVNAKTGKTGGFKIKNGSATKYVFPAGVDTKYNFYIRAYKVKKVDGKENYTYSAKTAQKLNAEPVRRMKFKITFARKRTLPSRSGSKVNTTFKAGKTVTAYSFDEGRYWFNYNGRRYRVSDLSVTGEKVATHSKTRVYSKEEAEAFVNKKGLTSSTSWLVWVNTYTQKLYVFKGSKGKWKIQKWGLPVSTGKPSTPTHYGAVKIVDKESSIDGLPYWSICSRSLYSLHGKMSSWQLGYPRSSGCVRNKDVNAYYVYKNCKVGTTVFVY